MVFLGVSCTDERPAYSDRQLPIEYWTNEVQTLTCQTTGVLWKSLEIRQGEENKNRGSFYLRAIVTEALWKPRPRLE